MYNVYYTDNAGYEWLAFENISDYDEACHMADNLAEIWQYTRVARV